MKHNYMYIGLFEVDLGLDDVSPSTDPVELDDINADPDTSQSPTSTGTSESPTSGTSESPTSTGTSESLTSTGTSESPTSTSTSESPTSTGTLQFPTSNEDDVDESLFDDHEEQ